MSPMAFQWPATCCCPKGGEVQWPHSVTDGFPVASYMLLPERGGTGAGLCHRWHSSGQLHVAARKGGGCRGRTMSPMAFQWPATCCCPKVGVQGPDYVTDGLPVTSYMLLPEKRLVAEPSVPPRSQLEQRVLLGITAGPHLAPHRALYTPWPLYGLFNMM